MCVITGDGGKGKGLLSQDLQYKDPIVTNTYHHNTVLYYCSLNCSRIPTLIVTLQAFLAITELTSYIGHKKPPVHVRGKVYNATIHLSFKPTINKMGIFVNKNALLRQISLKSTCPVIH